MTQILQIRNRFALVSLGAAMVHCIGCNADVSTPGTAPGRASVRRQVEEVEKDLKPPVVIKPNSPAETGNQPVQPKQD